MKAPLDPARCQKMIPSGYTGSFQCSRKWTVEESDGSKHCTQHCKATENRTRAKWQAESERQRQGWNLEGAQSKALANLIAWAVRSYPNAPEVQQYVKAAEELARHQMERT